MRREKTYWEKGRDYDDLINELRILFRLTRLPVTVLAKKSGVSNSHLDRFLKREKNISPVFILKILRFIIEDANYQAIQNDELRSELNK